MALPLLPWRACGGPYTSHPVRRTRPPALGGGGSEKEVFS